MKLFDLPTPSTVTELAAQTDAEPLLVARVIRMLVATSLMTEDPSTPTTYFPTKLAQCYRTGSPFAQAIIHFTTQNEVLYSLPSYFSKNGYSCPTDAYHGPFQFARKTKQHVFEWYSERPRLQQAMNDVMVMARSRGGKYWYEMFPVEEKLRTSKPGEVAVVDVGGGLGHVLVALKTKFPNLAGRLIVQDLPVVIESLKKGDLPEGIEAQGHNFFDLQPVKGAKLYCLRAVLHDWPDKQALQILANIKEAMDKESLLLINEAVIPERGVELLTTQMDFNMMSAFASLERTEEQWLALLKSAGFEIVQVWHPDKAGQSVFEARVKV